MQTQRAFPRDGRPDPAAWTFYDTDRQSTQVPPQADTMPSARSTVGTNLILSSLLATLSYLPFELVAKVTLLVCLLLFILDPYPGSRLVALVAVVCVSVINRIRQRYLIAASEGNDDTARQAQHETKKSQ